MWSRLLRARVQRREILEGAHRQKAPIFCHAWSWDATLGNCSVQLYFGAFVPPGKRERRNLIHDRLFVPSEVVTSKETSNGIDSCCRCSDIEVAVGVIGKIKPIAWRNNARQSGRTVRIRACQLWELAGRPFVNDDRFWREADSELKFLQARDEMRAKK